MAKVVSINTCARKGTPKQSIGQGRLISGLGLEGDAHAGPGLRQVSLLARESIMKFQESPLVKVCLKNGIFGENITTEGIVLHELRIGDILNVGDAILEVSKIGKECLKPCFIAKDVGDCIMPREGIFAKVISGGIIDVGDEIKVL